MSDLLDPNLYSFVDKSPSLIDQYRCKKLINYWQNEYWYGWSGPVLVGGYLSSARLLELSIFPVRA